MKCPEAHLLGNKVSHKTAEKTLSNLFYNLNKTKKSYLKYKYHSDQKD